MNMAFKELEDAGQSLYEAQKVQQLLKSIKNDDVQVQTTMGIIRDRYLNDFDAARLTLSRTISTRFANIEPMRNMRNIGAVNAKQGGRAGRGRGRARHSSGRGHGGGRQQKVIMNGVDVTDVTHNYTSDKWDKLRSVGGHTYVYQRREFLSGCGGRGERGGCGGNRGGGRGYNGGRYNERQIENEPRTVAATNTNTTDIVEYSGSTSTISTPTTATNSSYDRGGSSGGRFGPRRD